MEGVMTTVEVFDPAMCCSTGVCGPAVDPALAQFAADLEWLAARGVAVSRATVSQEPARFVAAVPVRDAMAAQGEAALPAVLVDGQLRSTGRYPARGELAGWAGMEDGAEPSPAVAPAEATLLPQAGGCCGEGGAC
jgi:hypothetical protein